MLVQQANGAQPVVEPQVVPPLVFGSKEVPVVVKPQEVPKASPLVAQQKPPQPKPQPKPQEAPKLDQQKPQVDSSKSYKKYYLGAGLTAVIISNLYHFYVTKQVALKLKLAKINADESLTDAQKYEQSKKAKEFASRYAVTKFEALKMALIAVGWVGLGVMD